MKHYVLYDNTGRILQTGAAPKEVLNHQKGPGQHLLVLEDGQVATVQRHYVAGKQLVAMPESPGLHFVFDYLLRKWVDPRTLQEQRDLKWVEVKTARNKAEMGRFKYKDMELDGDANSQRRLNAIISASKSALAAGQSYSKMFTLANNTVVELSAEDFVAIELARDAAVDALFVKARSLRDTIAHAATKEEIASISWS